jgi:hypothetical protein
LKPRVQGILSCKTTTATTSHDILRLEKSMKQGPGKNNNMLDDLVDPKIDWKQVSLYRGKDPNVYHWDTSKGGPLVFDLEEGQREFASCNRL